MERDWDNRAKENAKKYVALHNSKTDQDFYQSGLLHAQMILRQATKKPTTQLNTIDIGCGIGRIALHVAPQVKQLTLVDVSEEMLKRAKETVGKHNNVYLYKSDGQTLKGINSSTFDLAYSIWVFQHMPLKAYKSYLNEINRILKLNGILIFQIFEKTKFHGLFPKFWLRNLKNKHLIFWQPPPDSDTWTSRSYSKNEIQQLLYQAGFTILSYTNPTETEGDLWIAAQKTSTI